MVPNSDHILVLLEEPDLAYIDETQEAFNVIGLVSRSNFKALALHTLKRAEVPNCAYYLEPGSVSKQSLLLVGTTFLLPEE